jgi:hypothetical protein
MDNAQLAHLERLADDIVQRAVELQRLLIPSPEPGADLIRPGMDVQDRINTWPASQPLIFAAGEYGPITLPPHSGELRVVRGEATLPPGRIDPTAHTLPHFHAPRGPAITLAGGRYHLTGLEVSCADPDCDIVLHGSAKATRAEDQPDAVTWDRCYIHGDAGRGSVRGIAWHGRSTRVVGCVIIDLKHDGRDAQAIGGWNGPGPLWIEDCLLEASGENFMLGGSDAKIANLVPTSIMITGNHFRKPLAWRTETWDVKNLLELKNARAVVIRGNLFEGCWIGADQQGYAILFSPRNQNGGNPWAVVEDVLFEHNIVRDTASGINVLGYDEYQGSQRTRGITIRHNLVIASRAQFWGDGRFLMLGNSPMQVTVEHNTAIVDGATPIALYHGKTAPGTAAGIPDMVYRGNVFPHNKYGIKGMDNVAHGVQTLAAYHPSGVVFVENAVGGASAREYPPDNWYPARAVWEAGFVAYSGGDYRLRPDVPWSGQGCDFSKLPTVG